MRTNFFTKMISMIPNMINSVCHSGIRSKLTLRCPILVLTQVLHKVHCPTRANLSNTIIQGCINQDNPIPIRRLTANPHLNIFYHLVNKHYN